MQQMRHLSRSNRKVDVCEKGGLWSLYILGDV